MKRRYGRVYPSPLKDPLLHKRWPQREAGAAAPGTCDQEAAPASQRAVRRASGRKALTINTGDRPTVTIIKQEAVLASARSCPAAPGRHTAFPRHSLRPLLDATLPTVLPRSPELLPPLLHFHGSGSHKRDKLLKDAQSPAYVQRGIPSKVLVLGSGVGRISESNLGSTTATLGDPGQITELL